MIAVTGAAGGIGSLLCRRLREEGAFVIGADRLPCTEAQESLQADLGSFEGIAALGERLAELRVDMLVNLAGIQYFGPLQDQPAESLWAGYVVNLIAPAMLCRAVLPPMIARGHGRIVNIGSMLGVIPFAHFAAYSSTKAGLKGLSDALRRELAGSGVEVTHIAPRAVRTTSLSPAILRFADAPRVTPVIVQHLDQAPLGAGEEVMAAAAAAIANAFFDATGKRMDRFPFTPERVLPALA